ncbi:MAG: REP-associated tyrosine transposase [Gaiellales bacterium]|nr:REP-associated tyrosine transposase [Gaiellales bacterium]
MVCHVASRGNRKHVVFVDDRDRLNFMDVLGTVVERMDWHVLAYCLMDNHYHLLVELSDGNLADGMHLLNGTYARWFNERHGVVGHLFEKRYWSDTVSGEDHLLSVVAYIARNPVRAGVSQTVFEWPWSSAAASVGDAPAPPALACRRLWELVAESPDAARMQLTQLLDAPIPGEEVREAVRRQLLSAHRSGGLTIRELSDALRVSAGTVLKLMR